MRAERCRAICGKVATLVAGSTVSRCGRKAMCPLRGLDVGGEWRAHAPGLPSIFRDGAASLRMTAARPAEILPHLA